MEESALRRERNDRFTRSTQPFLSRCDTQRLDTFEDRLRLQHHTFAAAKRTIIDGLVTVLGKRAQVMNRDIYQSLLPRTTQYAEIEWPAKEVGKDGDDVEAHW